VRRGWMGVSVQDSSPQVVADYGLLNPRGVVVTDVAEGGPASRAGLRVGDVIEGMDAGRVERAHMLRWQVAARGVGHSVTLRVRRGEKPLRMRVKLEELPGELAPLVPAVASPAPGASPDDESATGGSGLGEQPGGQAPAPNPASH
jgi:serine protease Do